jgi:coenzyme PQQ synthesis protein D (PqqD)
MKQAIALASRARIPDGILYHGLQDELVLLNLHTGVYFGLNAIGTRMWQLIQMYQNLPLQHVLDSLLSEYDITPAQCTQDLLDLVACLEEKRLLEISR